MADAKKFFTKTTLIVLCLLLVGTFLRLYNFRDRLIYGPEQAISLITAAGNLEKFSLLGEVNVQRSTSTGLNPFHSPLFNYFLIPFFLLFDGKVLPISIIFVLLNLITGFILFNVTEKILNRQLALLTLFFFIFNAKMIHHSLFIWNLNFLPLLGILAVWWVYSLTKKPTSLSQPLLLGLISGVGFGLQYFFTPFALLIFCLVVFISKRKLPALALFLLGAVMGNLPMVIFDLRHDFYFVRTLWQYLMDVLQGRRVTSRLHYYDFFYLHPYLLILWSFIAYYFFKTIKIVGIFLLLASIFINLKSPLINFKESTGVVRGVNLTMLERAAAGIAEDSPPEKFNIVTLWDFDTRAHTLRYLLTYYHGLKPLGVEDYKNLDALYAYAPASYNIYNAGVYELSEFAPYKVTEMENAAPGYKLYKLTK